MVTLFENPFIKVCMNSSDEVFVTNKTGKQVTVRVTDRYIQGFVITADGTLEPTQKNGMPAFTVK